MPEHLSLTQFLAPYVAAVRSVSQSAWVAAEIAELSGSHHLYLTLLETDDEGKKLAELRASVWANGKEKLLKRFADGAGGEKLRKGLRVLLKLKPGLHPVFGFTATVEDIDPSFSLGDAARKLIELRNRLIADGLYERQRSLQPPTDFTRIAVVCPAMAAGLGDFKSHADPLAEAGLCEFAYWNATFQGERTSTEIVTALRAVFVTNRTTPFDAVIILRGGGAQSDLAWLNDFEIANAVAKMPVPVLVAIGHERDTTILDEIANVSFHTPSKAIGHITSCIIDNAIAASQAFEAIVQYVTKAVALYTQGMNSAKATVETAAGTAVAKAYQVIEAGRDLVVSNAKRDLDRMRADVADYHQDLRDRAFEQVSDTVAEIEAARELVSQAAKSQAAKADHSVRQSILVVRGEASKALALAGQEIAGNRNLVRDRSRLGCQILQRAVMNSAQSIFAKATADCKAERAAIEVDRGVIKDRTRLAVGQLQANTQRMGQFVRTAATKELAMVGAEIQGYRNLVRDRSRLGVRTVFERVDQAGQRIYRQVSAELAKSMSLIDGHRSLLRDRSRLAVRNASERVRANGESVLGMGPERTLKRGFVLARDPEGRPVTRKAQLVAGERIDLAFSDGHVGAVVEGAP